MYAIFLAVIKKLTKLFDLSARPETPSITMSLFIVSFLPNMFSLSSLGVTESLSSLSLFKCCNNLSRSSKLDESTCPSKSRLNFSLWQGREFDMSYPFNLLKITKNIIYTDFLNKRSFYHY